MRNTRLPCWIINRQSSNDQMNKADAQRRADQIRAFRAELDALGHEGVDVLTADRRRAVHAHHDAVLATLAAQFDIDRSALEKRMSLGMRIASAFGAAALTAAIVSFFYRTWPGLPTAAQVTALTIAPIAALLAMYFAARRERTLYVSSLCAIVACGAFVLQTLMLGDMFNLRGSPHVLAFWAAFALATAIPGRFVLPFAAGVAASICYIAALLMVARGAPWSQFGERMETVLLPAVAVLSFQRIAPRELQSWMRGTALVMMLAAILALSTFEAWSLLPWSTRAVSIFYQIVAAALATLVIAAGVKRGHVDTVTIGAIFAAFFLLGRFVDWWWDWMPKYLFFLILACVAVGWLWLLRVLRVRTAGPRT
jgi:Predicted membrane protein (DUF2157)